MLSISSPATFRIHHLYTYIPTYIIRTRTYVLYTHLQIPTPFALQHRTTCTASATEYSAAQSRVESSRVVH